MAHILKSLQGGECFEIDKIRIWDFYLLYPSKIFDIDIKPRKEKAVYAAREQWIEKERNPYEYKGDNRKLLEWIKPVQVSALSCLVSCRTAVPSPSPEDERRQTSTPFSSASSIERFSSTCAPA